MMTMDTKKNNPHGQRTLEEVERDITTLCKQIDATLKSNMSPKDKRITMEGFGLQKKKLDAEKASLLGGNKVSLFNCKVGKTVPVPGFARTGDIQEPKNPVKC